MMPRTLEQQITYMQACYPSLFGTRERALEHLFLVIGNGYEWHEGRLVGYGDDTPAPASLDEWLARKLADRPDRRGPRGVYSEDEERSLLLHMVETAKQPLTQTYPLYEYARACCVPDDVQPDYLEGAAEALGVAIDVNFAIQNYQEALRATDAFERLVARFPQLRNLP